MDLAALARVGVLLVVQEDVRGRQGMDGVRRRYRLFYDGDDYRILEIVNKIISRGKSTTLRRNPFDAELHPRGIKELAAPWAVRIASAMIDLLGTLEQGASGERIAALRAVRAESLHGSGQTLRLNASRVLVEIMKAILRSSGDEARQLALAHDFREASSGKSRLIRRQLRKYHLLEMPEEWNQLAFDYHVHDANTKGRKSPTHLIMDAWIKGIRTLEVIYYNLIRPEAAAELLEAAAIMDIDIRIGIEVSASLRGKPVYLLWTPRGFLGQKDFLSFIEEPEVRAFLAEGEAVVEHEKRRVLRLLEEFNTEHLPAINERYGLSVRSVSKDVFLESVGEGQASLVHLAEFVHRAILEELRKRTDELSAEYRDAGDDEREQMRELVASFNQLDSERLVEEYLRPKMNPERERPGVDRVEGELPDVLRLGPSELLDRLERLPCRSRITLNPSNLSPADVLEVLYEGRGRITHLEIFNLKDWAHGRTENRARINEIRLVINRGNVVEAKRLVRDILASVEADETVQDGAAAESLRAILWDLGSLLGYYGRGRLTSRIGSDSIGHSRSTRGMGFVVVATLPPRVRREIRGDPERQIPVATDPERHTTELGRWGKDASCGVRMPWRMFRWGGRHNPNVRTVTWARGHNTTTLADVGNIAALGGQPDMADNGLRLNSDEPAPASRRPGLRHLNSGVRNGAKIMIGLIPAFLTFYFTKDWWLLAYFGAVIWFAITGLRNILQSVIGGGGLRRSPLLDWKDYVSWSRVADSLFYTGFSVPLLDYLIKTVLLARGFNVTAGTQPVVLYSVMALVNGLYISSHNLVRGLPLGATIGNFFRTLLSIPVAIGMNFLMLKLVVSLGMGPEVAAAGMQLWAAVISKTASDFVAAIIEGAADRHRNLADRRLDYDEKLEEVFDTYGRLDVTLPEQDVLSFFAHPKELVRLLSEKNKELLRSMVINSLDLLHFWMFQPRARTALIAIVEHLPREELQFLVQSQQVLADKRMVSEMLLDGLVGKRFERALAFYLSQSDRYLRTFAKFVSRGSLKTAPTGSVP